MSKRSNKSKDTASLPDSPTKPSYTTFTEDSARQALVDARGDIFIASQMLGITAIRLDRAIRVSQTLQSTIESIQALPKGVPDSVIQEVIDRRVALYRVAGLDALHELATMPIDENSAQNQVKLAAAARLAGTSESTGGSDGIEETLRELNQSYQQSAPRLRVIRERTTIETIPERVVSDVEKQS